MTQTSLLPIICDRNKPPPQTADADCIAIQSSTERRFLCKSTRRHRNLPATEWICASLARAVDIPVADWAVVQMEGESELMFGSIWEGGGQDWVAALPEVSNKNIFSDAFALDLTVHNVDRNLGNYLYISLAGDIVAKLIDASRAFIYHGLPIPPLPMDDESQTMCARPCWEMYHPYDKARALEVAKKIKYLPLDWMTTTLDGMPSEWMDEGTREALDLWWLAERAERIEAVEHEL
ncbi:HipA domain-containing protein [Noviherbaspirillum sedimenti]|nr:HipA domain-containing protein [Noviherbaspirillum sedimenti]